jgi:hypothetical protein
MLKNIIFVLGLLLLCKCSNVNDVDVPIQTNDCSLKIMSQSHSAENVSNESDVNLSGIIELNYNYLNLLGVRGSAEADLGTRKIESVLYENSLEYSIEFMERHNAIINIICSLEKDRRNSDTLLVSYYDSMITELKLEYFELVMSSIKYDPHNNHTDAPRSNKIVALPLLGQLIIELIS